MRIWTNQELEEKIGAWQTIAIALFMLGTCIGLYSGNAIRGGLDQTLQARALRQATRPIILHFKCPSSPGAYKAYLEHDTLLHKSWACYFDDDQGQRVIIKVKDGWAIPMYPTPEPKPTIAPYVFYQ